MAVVLYGMIILACLSGTAGAGTDQQLLGTWQLTASVVDDQGTPCPFIPQQMEFTSQGMVIMAGMPFGPIPYRTDLTKDELSVVYACLPATAEQYESYHALKSRVHQKLLERVDLKVMETLAPEKLRDELKILVDRILSEEAAVLNEAA